MIFGSNTGSDPCTSLGGYSFTWSVFNPGPALPHHMLVVGTISVSFPFHSFAKDLFFLFRKGPFGEDPRSILTASFSPLPGSSQSFPKPLVPGQVPTSSPFTPGPRPFSAFLFFPSLLFEINFDRRFFRLQARFFGALTEVSFPALQIVLLLPPQTGNPSTHPSVILVDQQNPGFKEAPE